MRLPNHKTKIVCTIGPASRTEDMLASMLRRGMNVARLNFSHGSADEHRETIRRIRAAAAHAGRLCSILADLPGPKIRVGTLPHEPLLLHKGDCVTLTHDKAVLPTCEDVRIPVTYALLADSVSKGSTIYLNDGFIQLQVTEVLGRDVLCKVTMGGPLLSHKGLNLPQAHMLGEAVTPQDLAWVDFGLQEGLDTFSVSFVGAAADIRRVREHARAQGHEVHIVAKIERKEAVHNIDELLAAADGIMVARGDLGVQIPIEDVPGVQKQLIRKANLLGKPVITATQMLESMTENVRPTRAEVTDVANAILDGADAVMLSEETAIGKFPVETVHMMARVAASIERKRRTVRPGGALREELREAMHHQQISIEDVIALSAAEAAEALQVRYVLAPTLSGSTPRLIARFRLDCWVLAFTDNPQTHHFLAFSHGVYPFLLQTKESQWHDVILRLLKDLSLARPGARVILTEGIAPGVAGGTNLMRISTLA